MLAKKESLFYAVSSGNRLLPSGGMSDRMLSSIQGEFRVGVSNHDEDVIVVADFPGVNKESVGMQLVNPRSLEITITREQDT